MNNVFSADVVVVGAGVVGLAVAREFAGRGHEVIVLERHASFGTEISSRNSEVIHAGIYYPKNSLKARLCVAGKQLLYSYCELKGISFKRTGKLIVATRAEQTDSLRTIARSASDNGVDDLTFLDAKAVRDMEPGLNAVAALHSPSTGIVDSHGLMLAMVGDIESSGGLIAYRSSVEEIRSLKEDVLLSVVGEGGEQSEIRCKWLVNSTGLNAVPLAGRIVGFPSTAIPEARYARGSYFSYTPRSPFKRLIYPLPERGGLGIHLTLDLAGNARFGPDVEWLEEIDFTVNAGNKEKFLKSISKYFPEIESEQLSPDYAGIRPKIADENGVLTDFIISGPGDHGIPGIINLFGIESPGLTASFAIAGHVCDVNLSWQRAASSGPRQSH